MALRQVFEGTGAELQEYLSQHPQDRFRLILLSTNETTLVKMTGSGLRRGMFPELKELVEEDFKIAEWHGEGSEI